MLTPIFFWFLLFSVFSFKSCKTNDKETTSINLRIENIGKELIALDSINASKYNTNFSVKDVINVGAKLFEEIKKNIRKELKVTSSGYKSCQGDKNTRNSFYRFLIL